MSDGVRPSELGLARRLWWIVGWLALGHLVRPLVVWAFRLR